MRQGERPFREVAIGPGQRVSNAGSGIDMARIALLAAAPTGLLILLAWPMLFTDSGLGGDWTHHLFWVWSQGRSIAAEHHPSLFLNNNHSVLYPQYAFYGGTIYAIAGALSLLFGSAITAYVFTYLMGFAAAYGGWYWLARMAGLGHWRAQAPGLIFVTSAYYITLVYARGDWPEFVAVSTIPLVVASGLSVLRADSLSLWPAAALTASTIVFVGGHILTLIWASTTIVLGAGFALVWVPETRAWLTRRRALRVAALVAPAILINAWFLLPLIAYQSHTLIATEYPFARITLRNFMSVVSAAHLFSIGRDAAVPSERAFSVNFPTLVMVWTGLGTAIVLPRTLRAGWTRMLLVCACMIVLLVVLMTHAGILLALPRPYPMLEFSYRLDSYVLLWISGAVLCLLVTIRGDARLSRTLTWSLLPLLAIGIAQASHQVSLYPSQNSTREAAIREGAGSGPRQEIPSIYMDAKLPLLHNRVPRPEIYFPPAALHDDSGSIAVHVNPGQLVYTNVGGSPELVRVSGARIVGNTITGNDVMAIDPGAGSSGNASARRSASRPPEVVSVAPADPWPVALGRLLTLLAIALLAVWVLLAAVRRVGAAGRRRAK